MVKRRTVFPGAVVLLMLLAGCAGDSRLMEAPGDDLEAPRFQQDMGGVEGRVQDEEGLPLAGAMVGILRLDIVTLTNDQGRFVFDDVPPGRQVINVQRLGYESVATAVDVRVAEVTTVDVQLKQIRIEEPYHEIFGPFTGFFECRAGMTNGLQRWTGACGSVCAAVTCVWGPSLPNDATSMRFEMSSDDYRTVMGEMRWTQGSFATSQELRMSFSYVGRASNHWFCSGEGPSVLQWRYEKPSEDAAPECHGAGQGSSNNPPEPSTENVLLAYTNVPFPRFSTSNPTGELFFIALQQRFEFIVAAFYVEPAPAEFVVFDDV